jgi:hypothetical protein
MALHYLDPPYSQYVGKWLARKWGEYLYVYEVVEGDRYPIRVIELSTSNVGWEAYPPDVTMFDSVRPREVELQTVFKVIFEKEMLK